MSLSARRQCFVDEYLVDRNATKAAIRACYSPKTAEVQGSRLLRNAQVRRAIDTATAAQSKRTGITADRVLEELAIISFADPRHYKLSLLGGLELTEDAPASAMRAVASVKVKQYMHPRHQSLVSETEYRFWDKNSALTNLGRHFKLFTDKLEVSGSLADRLADARRRVQHGGMGDK